MLITTPFSTCVGESGPNTKDWLSVKNHLWRRCILMAGGLLKNFQNMNEQEDGGGSIWWEAECVPADPPRYFLIL